MELFIYAFCVKIFLSVGRRGSAAFLAPRPKRQIILLRRKHALVATAEILPYLAALKYKKKRMLDFASALRREDCESFSLKSL